MVTMTIWTTDHSTALLTDHYELTGLDAALVSGVAHHRATFELFSRGLPNGRRYGVVAGVARAVDAVRRFRFEPDELEYLSARGFLRQDTLDYLANYHFSGSIHGYRDGEVYFPYSPLITVDSTFGEALILETILLSVVNHDSAVASAAARMAATAQSQGRTTIEGGARRTHEQAGVSASLAAFIAGIDVTSNLEAGRRFDIPTAGTTMHAFTLAHNSEAEAFEVQAEVMGPGSTYLVDTYDIATGIERAVEAAGTAIGAVRLDSGDIGIEALRARVQLDSLGATGCQIVVSGDLDEYRVAELADAPIDRYMFGPRLVTGSGAPTAELVYKLVAIADSPELDADMRPVAKTSQGKGHRGGRKVATRIIGADGYALAERLLTDIDLVEPLPAENHERALQVPWIVDGELVRPFVAEASRAHHLTARAELRPEWLDLADGDPALVGAPPSMTSQPVPKNAPQEVPR